MKKALFLLAALCAAPLYAAPDSATDVLPHDGAITPVESPLTDSIEVAGFSYMGFDDIFTDIVLTPYTREVCKKNDFAGADFTYVHRFSPRNSVNLRFGYMYACQEWGMLGSNLSDLHIHSYNFPLMPGYRHDFLPGEHASIFWGINAGIGIQKVSERHYDISSSESRHASETKLGWGGSTELGLNVRFTPQFSVFAAWLLGCHVYDSNLQHTHQDIMGDPVQLYSGYRIGCSVAF